GHRRSEVIIATKFGMAVDEKRRGARPDYVLQAAEDSLRRLGTDRIDLYQIHQPDATVPIADTLEALEKLVKAGKVREIGCSNFSADQLRKAESAVSPGAPRFVSVQNEYSLLDREAEREVIPECERLGLALIPYFPLASGLLTGKYRRGEPPPPGTRLSMLPAERAAKALSERHFDTVEALTKFAEGQGHSVLELAFAWLAAQAAIGSIIAGATSPAQVAANVAAVAWTLSAEDLAEIDSLLEGAG